MELTQDRVRKLFDYREDGNLIWKRKPAGHRVETLVAGTTRPDNKISVGIGGRMYLIHRVIFLWHHGYLPAYVDHKDCNQQNNRIENLRRATKSQNGFNRGKASHNRSGIKGVSFDKRRGKWAAEITFNGSRKRLGRFNTLELAAQAYADAAKQYHGEFARV